MRAKMAATFFELSVYFYILLLSSALLSPLLHRKVGGGDCQLLEDTHWETRTFSHLNRGLTSLIKLKRFVYESMYKQKFPLIRSTKHRLPCLSLPFKPFKLDITIYSDIERNPGPNTCIMTKMFEAITPRFSMSCSTDHRLPVIFNYSRSTLLGLRKNYIQLVQPGVINQLKYFGIFHGRGRRAGKNASEYRYIGKINRRARYTEFCNSTPRHANFNNLIQINISPMSTIKQHPSVQMDFCLLNSRSIKNKVDALKDYTVDHDLDIFALTETWLTDCDNFSIGELCPTGYYFHHVSRKNSKGGGVGLLLKKRIQIKKQTEEKFRSFEYVDVIAKCSNGCIRIVNIYRPPPSKSNSLNSSIFFDEFSTLA